MVQDIFSEIELQNFKIGIAVSPLILKTQKVRGSEVTLLFFIDQWFVGRVPSPIFTLEYRGKRLAIGTLVHTMFRTS